MKMKKNTIVRRFLLISLLSILFVMMLAACGSPTMDNKEDPANKSGVVETTPAPTTEASGTTTQASETTAGSKDISSEKASNSSTGNIETALNTSSLLPNLFFMLIAIIISAIISIILIGQNSQKLKERQLKKLIYIEESVMTTNSWLENFSNRLEVLENKTFGRGSTKTAQKSADSMGSSSNSEADVLPLKMRLIETRLSEIEMKLMQNSSRSEPPMQTQRSSSYSYTPPPVQKRSTVSLSLEDKYNEMKRTGNENGFISDFRCERIGIKNYQGRNSDPNFNVILEKDDQGWFLMLQDSSRNIYAVPIFDAPLKSRYYDMFSTVYDFREVSSSNDFSLIKPAKLKALGNNKYETIEKGIIEI